MQEMRRDGMQKRENYLYVGIDLHKESHTAVLVNCWNEKLDAVWLIEKGYIVKDVNPSLAYDQRKSAPMMRENDEHDAYCVATVLINQLHTLPDAKPEDSHWTLSQLVKCRTPLSLKNVLHHQVSVLY